MELQDLTNSKPVKAIAATGIATAAVVAGTSPVMAHGSQSPDYTKSSDYSHSSPNNDAKDCPPDQKPMPALPPVQTTPVTPVSTPPVVTPPVTPTPTVDTPATATITPVDTTEVAAITPEAPKELPKTGPAAVVAPVAAVGILGYLGNLFRLKRKQQ